MSNWINAKVTNIHWWNEKLFSITLAAELADYSAGQFTKLAMQVDGRRVARAYSFVNSPNKNIHEFLLVKVDEGKLTPPLSSLSIGDELEIDKNASGFFTVDEVPSAKQLWLLATGTAIGPFLSILNQSDVWRKFEKIVLVHGVRTELDLVYTNEIEHLICEKKLQFIPVISQQTNIKAGLSGRITYHIACNTLFEYCNLTVAPENTQFMLCGNPNMVKETFSLLNEKGFSRNRRAAPGHITMEHYW